MSLTTRHSRRLALLGVLIAGLLLAGTGSAYGYLRSTGHGTGTVQAGTLEVSVQAIGSGDSNAGQLLPGHTADAIVRVHNPNQVPVQLTGVIGTGPAQASNGCAPTGVSFTDQSGLDTSIPAGSSVLIELPGAVAMSVQSAAACQGATFTLPVTVTVHG